MNAVAAVAVTNAAAADVVVVVLLRVLYFHKYKTESVYDWFGAIALATQRTFAYFMQPHENLWLL